MAKLSFDEIHTLFEFPFGQIGTLASPAPVEARTDEDEEGGSWRTINGARVHFNEAGEPDKGPANVLSHLQAKQAQAAGTLPNQGGPAGGSAGVTAATAPKPAPVAAPVVPPPTPTAASPVAPSAPSGGASGYAPGKNGGGGVALHDVDRHLQRSGLGPNSIAPLLDAVQDGYLHFAHPSEIYAASKAIRTWADDNNFRWRDVADHFAYTGGHLPGMVPQNATGPVVNVYGKTVPPIRAGRDGQRPKAIVMMGLPASGKSSLLSRLVAPEDKDAFHVTDADEIKKTIPGYDPAVQDKAQNDIHKESIQRGFDQIDQHIEDGKNVVWDITGCNPNAATVLQKMRAAGYDIHLVHADVTPITSLYRNENRARSVPEWSITTAASYLPTGKKILSRLADHVHTVDNN